jgi:ABC-type transport system involved in multi-copper enzyme maturation permease subunit
LGLLFAILAKSESLALFIPVCIWVGISFVMPELVTGQTPTALLNPVTIDQILSQGNFFSLMQQFLTPISIGWHYTSLGSQLLNATADTRSSVEILLVNTNNIVVLAIALMSSYLLMFTALQKYDVQNDAVQE